MDCDAARPLLIDHRRGRLDVDAEIALLEHLESCSDCRARDDAEGALDDVLAKLPRHAAPPALRASIAARRTPAPTPSVVASRPSVAVPLAFVAGLAVAASVALALRPAPRDATLALAEEAVNDHVRVTSRTQPYDVVSSDAHVVKPWFIGKLDIAPRVAFEGDAEFPLEGGVLAYFVDRPAGAFVYRRRRHVITAFVLRAEGLAWPTSDLVPIGHARGWKGRVRGFSTILVRDGDLAYAFVSDMDASEVETLAALVVGK
jgi:anti-sigma factor RsiW